MDIAMPVKHGIKLVADNIGGIAFHMDDTTSSLLATSHYHYLGFIQIGKLFRSMCRYHAANLAVLKTFAHGQALEVHRQKKIGNIEIVGHEEGFGANL